MTPEVKVGDKVKIDYFLDQQTGRHPDSEVLEILESFNGKPMILATTPKELHCKAMWLNDQWRLMCFTR